MPLHAFEVICKEQNRLLRLYLWFSCTVDLFVSHLLAITSHRFQKMWKNQKACQKPWKFRQFRKSTKSYIIQDTDMMISEKWIGWWLWMESNQQFWSDLLLREIPVSHTICYYTPWRIVSHLSPKTPAARPSHKGFQIVQRLWWTMQYNWQIVQKLTKLQMSLYEWLILDIF